MTVTFRPASADDAGAVLGLIKELALYEKSPESVKATEELLKKNVFEKGYAEVLLAFVDGESEAAGFALYFFNFSTWTGKPGIYLEDLFVKEKFRANGIGKGFFRELGKIAREKDCGRIDWWVLKWNEPSINFYKRIGAVEMVEWQVMRLEGESLSKIVDLD
ncbi:N-acetyltransferase GCN5 [Atractiella rhizophila]|nr:N-acetyltransferase GCN5 [Atractiella rhizophila]